MTVVQQVARSRGSDSTEPPAEIEVAELPLDGRAAGMADGIARPRDAREVGGGRNEPEPLVRRARDAARFRDRGRARLVREPLAALEAVRGGRARREDRLLGVRHRPCRSIFKRVTTLFNPVSALTDNGVVNVVQARRRAPGADRDPAAGRVRRRHARDARRDRLGRRHPGRRSRPRTRTATGGELINYAAHLGPVNRYRIYTLAPGGKPRWWPR